MKYEQSPLTRAFMTSKKSDRYRLSMGIPTRYEKSIANEFLSFTRAPLTALTTYLINFGSPNQTLPTTSHNTPLHGSPTALWWCQAWLVTELKASTPGDKAQMLAPTPALAAAQKLAVSLALLAGVVVGVLLADDGQVAVGVHQGFDVRGAVAAALGGAGRHIPTGRRTDAEADFATAAIVLRRLRVLFRFSAQGDVVLPTADFVVARLPRTGAGGADADADADADAQAHAVGGAGSPLQHGAADASVRPGGLVQADTPLSQRHLNIILSYRRK
ncbi:hypothetical protein [Stenotrophomonas maltophilia]|uniref:hypothetical protein n=1 Tax=Stenotrophomonas maltophilia TaxID=40324 RepID=UPI0021CA27DF|nr:hypothetical protein [Stenotrophomonas maltophilia]